VYKRKAKALGLSLTKLEAAQAEGKTPRNLAFLIVLF
jgi:hypothetical protein